MLYTVFFNDSIFKVYQLSLRLVASPNSPICFININTLATNTLKLMDFSFIELLSKNKEMKFLGRIKFFHQVRITSFQSLLKQKWNLKLNN